MYTHTCDCEAMSVVGDLLGCCVSGTLSMPFHQLYNYTVANYTTMLTLLL